MPPGMKMWMHASAFGFFFAAGSRGAEPQVLVERQAQRPDRPDVKEVPAVERRTGTTIEQMHRRTPFGVGARVWVRGQCRWVDYRWRVPVSVRERGAGSAGGCENDMAASFSQVEDSRGECGRQFNPGVRLDLKYSTDHMRTGRNPIAWHDPVFHVLSRLAAKLRPLACAHPGSLNLDLPPALSPSAPERPHAAHLPLARDRCSFPRPPAADPVDYRKDIRPVLQERCYACHGALAQKAKLRVDSGANLLKRGVIVPGKPGESELIARVSSERRARRGCRPRGTRSSRSRSRSSRPGSSRARRCPPTMPRNPTRATTGRSARPSDPDHQAPKTKHQTRSTRSSPRSGREGPDARQARRQARAPAPRVPRPHRPAADREPSTTRS